MSTEPITPGDELEAHTRKLVSASAFRRLSRLVNEANRQFYLERKVARVVLLLFTSCMAAILLVVGWATIATRTQRETTTVHFSDMQSYAAAVRHKVRANLVIPPDVPLSATATVDIALSEAGSVADLKVVNSSGFIAYDEVIQKAILAAQPFPLFANSAGRVELKRLRLKFKAGE